MEYLGMSTILFVNREVVVSEKVRYRYARDMKSALAQAREPCVISIDDDTRIWLEPGVVFLVAPTLSGTDKDLSVTIAITKILRRIMQESGYSGEAARDILLAYVNDMEQ